MAARVHTIGDESPDITAAINDTVSKAVVTDRVLHLHYVSGDGTHTNRDVEPLGLLRAPAGWSLVAWCRLRAGVRGFRLDRIAAATLTDEYAPPREVEFGAELDRIGAAPLDR